MIRTVGVIQLKYYYKMNINSIQIQFIEYAFHSNRQNCGEMPCQSQILLSRLEAGMLPNLVFSDEKKFDIQHHVNPQNDHVWSHDGGGRTSKSHSGPRVSVSDGLGSRYRIWKKSFDFRSKLNQENYRNDILVSSLLPWAKEHFKNILGRFNKIRYHHMELKRCRSGYQSMFPTSFPKKNGPLHHPI